MQWKTEVGGEGILSSHSVLRLSAGLTGPTLFSDLLYKHQVENREAVHKPKSEHKLLPFNGLKSFYILKKSVKWISDRQPCK